MHGRQHKKMGTAAGVGVLVYTVSAGNNPMAALCMLTTPIGAMLPDIDHDMSKLGQSRKKVVNLIKLGVSIAVGYILITSYLSGGILIALINLGFLIGMMLILWVIENNKFIKKQLGFITMHRGIMHTLVPPAFIFGTTLWTSNEFYFYAVMGLCIGYVVHLIGDMATVDGAPVLWPLFKSNIRYSWLSTTKHGFLIEIVCNAWCIAFVLFGIFLGR